MVKVYRLLTISVFLCFPDLEILIHDLELYTKIINISISTIFSYTRLYKKFPNILTNILYIISNFFPKYLAINPIIRFTATICANWKLGVLRMLK